jgi:hypothetical protein
MVVHAISRGQAQIDIVSKGGRMLMRSRIHPVPGLRPSDPLSATRGGLRLLVPLLALAVISALPGEARAQGNAPGGFLEQATSTEVRSRVTPVLPDRGPFLFPAPYGTQGVRVTNAGDCNGNDCVRYVGYSYWRNTNNHVGSNTMLIVLTLDRSRGGGGPTLFSYDKTTNQVQKVGPLFDASSSFSWATGEGWYWSPTLATTLYIPSGSKLHRYDVSNGQLTTVFDAAQEFGANTYIWQVHTSADDKVHSASLRSSTDFSTKGCLTYDERTAEFSFAARTGDFDECQVDKSGRWLLVKENTDGTHAEDNVIYDLAGGSRTTLLDQQGAAGHSDNGHGYVVGEDNWNALPGAIRVWHFGQPMPGSSSGQGTLVYRTTDWAVDAGHISHANAKAGVPVGQQYACLSRAGRANLPRANEVVCFRLDGSLQALVVAPVMTSLDASGGGDDYAKLPKGNLDVTGQYFVWTSNVGGNRLDAFVVRVPSHLLVAGGGGDAGSGGGGTGGSASAGGGGGAGSGGDAGSGGSGGGAGAGGRADTPPDGTGPGVTVTAPSRGASVSGIVTVEASVSDDVGVAGVQFKLDGTNIGPELTKPPFALQWNTAASGNGVRAVTAVARDSAGNTTSSGPVIIRVFNGTPGSSPGSESRVRRVTWTQPVNVTASRNSLQKTSGCEGCPDAGAVSEQRIFRAAGGSVQITASETTTLRHVGLADRATWSGPGLPFALALRPGGVVEVRENGVYRVDTSFTPGDVFRITVQRGVVSYYKNGTRFYRSAETPAYPLAVHASLSTLNGTIQDALVIKP